MGAEAGWEPIKVYASLYGLDQDTLSREQIKQKLDASKPDEVYRAGQAFIDAADLVGGKVGGNGPSEIGIQAALSRTAKELAEVWRGPAAEQVQSALRALYATAGALGEAMTRSGVALSSYADAVRDAKTNFPAAPSGSDENAGGGTTGSPAPDPDETARTHFRALNQRIQEVNDSFAEGLAFQLPAIEPLRIDLANSPRIHVGGTGAPVTSSDGVWHGRSYGDGTAGSGYAGPGSTGSGSGGPGSGGTGADGSGVDGSGGAGGPGTTSPSPDPGGSPDPGQASTGQTDPGQADQGQTGPGPASGSGDGPGTAPAVIGGSDRTDLATTHPLPGGTVPAGAAPPTLTGYPDPHIPVTTAGPTGALPPGGVIGTYGGARTGYGVGAAGEAGAVLGGYRTGQGGAGSSYLPYAPAAGGAGAGGQDEREREIYDPEPDVWRVTSAISPDRIG
ncbi:WXG100 family type VII secretion target [Microbispora sp. CA-135349]|uniref:WXG100 family type VII secretion target n=1 Tax=Microbispora sp. CA-135349 TaxID=3239953 RepID=UPI003D929505